MQNSVAKRLRRKLECTTSSLLLCQWVCLQKCLDPSWILCILFPFLTNNESQHCDTDSFMVKSKQVKCTLVQAPRLCTGRTAHRGSRGIALLFHDHGTRRGWGVSVMPLLLFTPGKDPVPIVQEAGWAPGPVWTGAENLAPTRIWSLDHPARSQSLYRLRYPAHLFHGSHFILSLCSPKFIPHLVPPGTDIFGGREEIRTSIPVTQK